jgi:hypothetical protein
VTTADAPLTGQDDMTKATDLPAMKSEIFFSRGLDGQISLTGLKKSLFWRNAHERE